MQKVELANMKSSSALTRLSNALLAAKRVSGAERLTVLVHPEDRTELMTEAMRDVVEQAGARLMTSEGVERGTVGIEASRQITA